MYDLLAVGLTITLMDYLTITLVDDLLVASLIITLVFDLTITLVGDLLVAGFVITLVNVFLDELMLMFCECVLDLCWMIFLWLV